VHGYAYGESIVGAEPTPLVAYLAGFTLIQLAIVLAAFAAARYVDRGRPSFQTAGAVGGALSVAGVAFLALSLI
jgi:urease accessory protein